MHIYRLSNCPFDSVNLWSFSFCFWNFFVPLSVQSKNESYSIKCRSIFVRITVVKLNLWTCLLLQVRLLAPLAMANNRKLVKLLLVVNIVYICIDFTSTRSPSHYQSKKKSFYTSIHTYNINYNGYNIEKLFNYFIT